MTEGWTGPAETEKGWTEPAEVREILGLGWAQQTPMAAPCLVVLTLGGAREALTLGGAREAQNWTEPAETKVSWTGPAETKVSLTGPPDTKVSWAGPAETNVSLPSQVGGGSRWRGMRRFSAWGELGRRCAFQLERDDKIPV